MAIVDIPPLILVLVVHLRLFVLVAVDARELVEIAGAMAFGTVLTVRSTVDGKRVIEDRLVPGRMARAMAILTVGRKTGRYMIGVLRTAVVIRMASIAVFR